MVVFGTQMHIITFLICLLELVFLAYQVVYYLSRPSDKKRKYYLIFLYLLIQNNIVSGLLPDPNFSMNIILQSVFSYGVSFAMVIYIPFYFYRAYELPKLKFHAYWGVFLFLFCPYLLCFVIPYAITGNLQLSVRICMIVPFFYALSLLYYMKLAINEKNRTNYNVESSKELNRVYMGIVFFALLPIMAFFKKELDIMLEPVLHFNDGSQVVEVLITNASLLVFTIYFIRSTVKQSIAEYERLQESERELQKLNSELTEKVKERTRELELVHEERTNAFINLAHETKTPLTLISTYLRKYIEKTNQQSNEELKLLERSIGKLTKDIVNFFDMEKIRKGISMYDHNKISNLSEILSESIKLFQVYAEKKQIEINNNIEGQLFIKADPCALNRIINNIIENALKYSHEKSIVNITLKCEDENVFFSVSDNGIGIALDIQEKIFEPYFQINSRKANFQGMGLGLSIVKKILLDIQGNIMILSEGENKGTNVIIQLPKYKISENEIILSFSDNTSLYFELEQKLTIKEQPNDPNKPTILVVEDNVEVLTNIVEHLNKMYNVLFALNGTEALNKLNEVQRLDLIISDVMMDNGDGFFLFENIAKNNKYAHLPFIFLTAKNTFEDKLQGLNMGAIDYICKPIELPELSIKIQSILNNLTQHTNAVITHAYNSIVRKNNVSNIQPETIIEKQPSGFDMNCFKFKLSTREVEVVQLMAQGKINKEIGSLLNISVETVKKHVQNCYEKANVGTKIELLKKLQA